MEIVYTDNDDDKENDKAPKTDRKPNPDLNKKVYSRPSSMNRKLRYNRVRNQSRSASYTINSTMNTKRKSKEEVKQASKTLVGQTSKTSTATTSSNGLEVD